MQGSSPFTKGSTPGIVLRLRGHSRSLLLQNLDSYQAVRRAVKRPDSPGAVVDVFIGGQGER